MHAKILIVDDNTENIQVLFDLLTAAGYSVLIARNGPTAFRSVQEASPDLILLDVLMPEMDGFDVCRRLKQDDRTRDIPVIFLTGLAETVDKLRGFEVGGVDYITKPFQLEEVLARIKSPLVLYHTQRQLREQNRRLQREIAERQRSEHRYRLLAENATDVIWTTDLQGHFTYISPSVEQLCGYTPKEMMPLTLLETLTPASAEIVLRDLQRTLQKVRDGHHDVVPLRRELGQLCKDGTTVRIEVIAKRLYDES